MELHFDRGTLVLRGAGPDCPAASLPGLVWDERVAAWRAPALEYPALRRGWEQRRLPIVDLLRCARVTSGPGLVAPELRGYQTAALASWEAANRRGLVVLPTGAGKTRVALAAIAAVDRPTLVLVPTRALLAQWVNVLHSAGVADVGQVGDGEYHLAAVTVCTFESAFRRMDDFGDRFALLVVDEAHHFATGAREEALEMCAATWRLGLSATPPRQADELSRLERVVGPVVCVTSIQELTGTSLAPLERVVLPVDLSAEERTRYDACYLPFAEAARGYFRSASGGNWADFTRALAAGPAGVQLLAGYHEAVRIVGLAEAKLERVHSLLTRHRGSRSLVFTAGNDEAYALSRELLVPAITCAISAAERAAVLRGLRDGTLRSLVSSRVLNEGVDVPEASVAIVCGGRLGEREHVQRVGRVLRPQPGKLATVYELVVRGTFEERQSFRRVQGIVPRTSYRRPSA